MSIQFVPDVQVLVVSLDASSYQRLSKEFWGALELLDTTRT